MEIALLINGLLFAFLLFTGQLSQGSSRNGRLYTLMGLVVFGVFAILFALLYLMGYQEAAQYLTWGAIVITSGALLIRFLHMWR